MQSSEFPWAIFVLKVCHVDSLVTAIFLWGCQLNLGKQTVDHGHRLTDVLVCQKIGKINEDDFAVLPKQDRGRVYRATVICHAGLHSMCGV